MESVPQTPQSATSTTSDMSFQSSGSIKEKDKNKVGSQRKKSRTKLIYFWRSEDVNKWLRRHCGQYHQLYGDMFTYHDINGRSLMRLTDSKLQIMGIENGQHREDLMRHILRLKLKTESQELKTLDQKNTSLLP